MFLKVESDPLAPRGLVGDPKPIFLFSVLVSQLADSSHCPVTVSPSGWGGVDTPSPPCGIPAGHPSPAPSTPLPSDRSFLPHTHGRRRHRHRRPPMQVGPTAGAGVPHGGRDGRPGRRGAVRGEAGDVLRGAWPGPGRVGGGRVGKRCSLDNNGPNPKLFTKPWILCFLMRQGVFASESPCSS